MARDDNYKQFIVWLRETINSQATYGNNVCVGDYSRDGMTEYLYPKEFTVNGDKYWWSIGSRHTKGRHLCTYYELWFHGKAFGNHQKIATGSLTLSNLRKGFRVIYNFYSGVDYNV